MKRFLTILATVIVVAGCKTTMKLDIPERFSDQADFMKVSGARTRTMHFGNFSTSKIKRGWHISSGRYGKRYFLQNILLNEVGIQKDEVVEREKDKFSFSISDGSHRAEVATSESEVQREDQFKIRGIGTLFNNISQLKSYSYVFDALIVSDYDSERPWEFVLSKLYDRRADTVRSIFTAIGDDDAGIATNGVDTLQVRSLNIKKTETPSGKTASLLVKVKAGYEISRNGEVIAILDNIQQSVWIYKELDEPTRLVVAAITTAIFGKRVHDVKW